MAVSLSPLPAALARLKPGQFLVDGTGLTEPWWLPAHDSFVAFASTAGLLVTPGAGGGRAILAGPVPTHAAPLALSLAPGSAASPLTLRGFTRIELLGADTADAVAVIGATDAWVSTGGGADTITLTEAKGGTLQVDAGAGNDTVTLRGNGQTKAQVRLGDSWDRLTLSGMVTVEVDAGLGDDLIALTLERVTDWQTP